MLGRHTLFDLSTIKLLGKKEKNLCHYISTKDACQSFIDLVSDCILIKDPYEVP